MFNTVLARRKISTNLVSILPGYGDTGAALVSSGVDKILFIGSPGVGQVKKKKNFEIFRERKL